MPDTVPGPDDAPVFLLGLTMAGAVSAGAYSAGVLDYLFRAIDAHNARVRQGPTAEDPAPPRHKVVVKVITGASAGGICAGLTLAGLLKNRDPSAPRLGPARTVPYTDKDGNAAQCQAVLAPLFDAWIDQIRLWDATTGTGFLATGDLEGDNPLLGSASVPPTAERPVFSALDSSHLDEATRAALAGVTPLGTREPYDFLAADLDVFVTTTDLHGVIYRIRFPHGEYRMAQHGNPRHFRVSGLGQASFPSTWLDSWRDQGIPLDPNETDEGGSVPFVSRPESSWYALTVAAIASGAFPVGLAARTVSATVVQLGEIDPETSFTQGGALPIEIDDRHTVLPRPYFNGVFASHDAAPYVAVDGGVINNEPFEIARYTLRRPAGQDGAALLSNDRAGDKADRAVIMIDPFPRTPEYALLKPDEIQRLGGLLPSLLRLFPALVDQARFKIDSLFHASDSEVHSRFMIAPECDATEDRPEAVGADAIACGAIGGFSGFFDRSFRLHDFVLGQRNCQQFLRSHFLLDADNPILGLGDDHPAVRGARTQRASGEAVTHGRRIIDACVTPGAGLDAEIRTPLWPRISLDQLRPMLAQFHIRLSRMGARLFDIQGLGATGRMGLGLLWRGIPLVYGRGLKGDVAAAASRAVLKAFLLREQLATGTDFSPGTRLAMIRLIDAGGEAQTAADLRQALEAGKQAGLYPADLALPEADEIEAALRWMERARLARRPLTNWTQPFRYRYAPH